MHKYVAMVMFGSRLSFNIVGMSLKSIHTSWRNERIRQHTVFRNRYWINTPNHDFLINERDLYIL